MKNAIQVFAEPQKHLGHCASCLKNLVKSLPSFLNNHLHSFIVKLHSYNEETMQKIIDFP